MLNYDHLAALTAVISEGSFQRAARMLHLTQSAVSQRIHALEEQVGGPVIFRGDPLRLTPLGERLRSHVNKVQLLERELEGESGGDKVKQFTRLRLGVNADSIATWFFNALTPVIREQGLVVELLVDNEDHTLDLLRRGEVSGCVASQPRAVPGSSCEEIGSISYRCVCTPDFEAKFFPKGFTKESVAATPTIIFDAKDTVQEKFFRTFFSRKITDFPYHLVPSNEGFLQSVLCGAGYAMIPIQQAQPYFKSKHLVDLGKGTAVRVRLYLHWILKQTETQRRLRSKLLVAAQRGIKR